MSPIQLLAQGWTENGYSGVGDYCDANGNTVEVMNSAHAIRDGVFDTFPADVVDTGEVFDCVVVGGGISGLASALFFKNQARSGRTCLVLDNHPIFGGEAKRNEFNVNGTRLLAPQGANQAGPQIPGSLMDHFYRQAGFDPAKYEYPKWNGPSPEMPLSQTVYVKMHSMPPTFGFYFGAKFGQRPGMWLVDPWGKNLEGAPFPAGVKVDLLKWRKKEVGAPGDAPRPFEYSGDEKSRHLDSITMEDLYVQSGLSRETIRMFFAPITAQGRGVGPDALSGFSEYFRMPGKQKDIKGRDSYRFRFEQVKNWHCPPGGLAEFCRHIVKTLMPDAIQGPSTPEAVCRGRVNFEVLDRPGNPVRIRLRSTVVRVEHEGDSEKSGFVQVTYTRNGKVYRLKARSAVMAGGGWSTKRVVRDLGSDYREAYNNFLYSAVLVANVAVRNWRYLHKMGFSGGRWFGEQGFLGDWTEIVKTPTFGSYAKTIGPGSPTVLTLYAPLFYPGLPTVEQGHKGRAELFSTSFREYERRIREQFDEMFSHSGFNPRRDILGIILNRWGHAFCNTQPGFFFGKSGKPAPRDVIRNQPFGRIAFAHTDLAGFPYHGGSVTEAYRAVEQLLKISG
ncbi:MAG: NAD(P)-binding protein [Acidobacteria bacterium]|nr:NAD(P)-binding protein [Acidobacteriota bacterium]MCI0723619.1 NAD(P)-binding protein [Acidobacteriota bacterium]